MGAAKTALQAQSQFQKLKDAHDTTLEARAREDIKRNEVLILLKEQADMKEIVKQREAKARANRRRNLPER